jgi:hypothetical protein
MAVAINDENKTPGQRTVSLHLSGHTDQPSPLRQIVKPPSILKRWGTADLDNSPSSRRCLQ